mgnify:CR=1 FL=1
MIRRAGSRHANAPTSTVSAPAAAKKRTSCIWISNRNCSSTFTANHAHLVPEGIDGFVDALDMNSVFEVRLADCFRNGYEVHLKPGAGDLDFGDMFRRVEGKGFKGHYTNAFATLDDMPEMREPVLEWRPVGYATHFRMTGFRDRDLAVAAYESVPDAVKVRFFAARREVELAIIDVQDLMEAAPEASSRLAARAPEIFAAIARLGGVISGGEARAADTQSDVDSLFS